MRCKYVHLHWAINEVVEITYQDGSKDRISGNLHHGIAWFLSTRWPNQVYGVVLLDYRTAFIYYTEDQPLELRG